MPDLSGVNEKLRRANRHLADFEEAVAYALDPDRYHFAFDTEVEGIYHVYRVYGVPEVNPDWPLMVGDCLNNFRAALDHLAWQLVLLAGGNPNENTQFPIRDAPFGPKKKRGGGIFTDTQLNPRISRLDILDRLELAQPYRGIDGRLLDSHESFLWALRVVNNIDKHRLLLPVVCAFDPKQMWWAWSGDDPSVKSAKVNRAPLKDGDPVAWFEFYGDEPREDFDPHAVLQVGIHEKEAPLLYGRTATNNLHLIQYTVEHEVIRSFRSLF